MSARGLMRGVMLIIDLSPTAASTVLTIKNQYFLAAGAAEVGAKQAPIVTYPDGVVVKSRVHSTVTSAMAAGASVSPYATETVTVPAGAYGPAPGPVDPKRPPRQPRWRRAGSGGVPVAAFSFSRIKPSSKVFVPSLYQNEGLLNCSDTRDRLHGAHS